jgi:hypothetical protein
MFITIYKYYDFDNLSINMINKPKEYEIDNEVAKKIPIIKNMLDIYENDSAIEIDLNVVYQIFELVIKFVNGEDILQESDDILFYALNDKNALIYLGFDKCDEIIKLIEEYFYDRKVNKDPLELAIEFNFSKNDNKWFDDNIFNLPKINGEYLEEDKIYIEECKKYYNQDEYIKIYNNLIYTNEIYISKYSKLPEKIKQMKKNNDKIYRYFEKNE